jgi:ribosomal protein L21E
MKSIIPVLILCLLVCSSCKKDHSKSITPDSKNYTLTFKVSGFSQTDTIFEAGKQVINSTKSVNNVISPSVADVLYCNIYDTATGKIVGSIKQLSTYLTFGTISLGVPKGNYTIVFAAGKTGLIIDRRKNQNPIPLRDDFLRYTLFISQTGIEDNTIKDTFYGKINITVDQDHDQNIVLNRIVAQLSVTIEDKLPPDGRATSIVLNPSINGYPVNGDKPFVYTQALQLQQIISIPFPDRNKTNYTIKTLIFTDGSPFTLSLFAYSSVNLGAYLAKKDIPGVTAAANKTTIITGQLFKTYNNGEGFHVYIDPDWNPTPVTVPF